MTLTFVAVVCLLTQRIAARPGSTRNASRQRLAHPVTIPCAFFRRCRDLLPFFDAAASGA
jgi:hypothetical protein